CVFTGSRHNENHPSQVKKAGLRVVPKPSEEYLSPTPENTSSAGVIAAFDYNGSEANSSVYLN
ncbi:hypothetical protein, partial [Halorubrum sp. SS7]|uniref:hypothetical protein n=1 Tax=Halorubrum sp. SS7 TaxID=2518119 RepID=UPI001A7E12E7